MDGHVAFLLAAVAVQLFLAADEVRSLMLADDAMGHLHTLSTDVIGVISTLLTAVYSHRLRRVRHSLRRVERSLQIDFGGGGVIGIRDGGGGGGGCWSVPVYCNRAWLAAAVTAFGYLKYGQLMQSDDVGGGEQGVYATVASAVLCTVSMAGNYYVIVMFVDHVLLMKRSVYDHSCVVIS